MEFRNWHKGACYIPAILTDPLICRGRCEMLGGQILKVLRRRDKSCSHKVLRVTSSKDWRTLYPELLYVQYNTMWAKALTLGGTDVMHT